MQRTGRLAPLEMGKTRKSLRKCSGNVLSAEEPAVKGPSWRPRERRLRFETTVLYRCPGETEWRRGRSINISRSGLLFRAEGDIPVGTALELLLEMPAEITGQPGEQVTCQAKVARTAPAEQGQPPWLGVAIDSYEFVAEQRVSGQ
jgi:hypothetical protein